MEVPGGRNTHEWFELVHLHCLNIRQSNKSSKFHITITSSTLICEANG